MENRPTTGATVYGNLAISFATSGGAYAAPAFVLNSYGDVTARYWTGHLISNGINIQGQLSRANGLGSVSCWHQNAGDYPIGFNHAIRTDAASAVVCFSCYDRNAASITNAATMRLHSFGWTNNADAYTELGAHLTDGSLWLGAGNSYSDDGSTATGGVHYGAGLNIKSLSGLVTIAAAATTTSTIQIPAGAVVLGVSCRVTTVIPTAATFSVGHAGSTALWGTGIAVAAGTTNTGAAVPALFAAATGILITPNATPADNTGRLRVVIHYYIPTAPTS
jgi:hypothetical protein